MLCGVAGDFGFGFGLALAGAFEGEAAFAEGVFGTGEFFWGTAVVVTVWCVWVLGAGVRSFVCAGLGLAEAVGR